MITQGVALGYYISRLWRFGAIEPAPDWVTSLTTDINCNIVLLSALINMRPVNFNRHFGFHFIAAAVLFVTFGLEAASQPQASGGKVTSGAAAATGPATKPSAKTPAKAVPRTSPATKSTSPGRTAGPAASIEGKWWTTGNGFGDAEVIFTQTGSSVSGVLRYADGRTGTVTGAMVGKRLQHSWTNSAGEGGTGWLELSWNNFLGGPWRNQRTNDGSWTLSRIEGNWCFGGSRNRIRRVTHDARGRIAMITEDGSQEEGHLEGPWLFLHSDLGSIKGEMNFRANRVEWSTGFYWTWCGR